MKQKILDHYKGFSMFTNPGCYKEYLQSLPGDIHELLTLVRLQAVHRVTLLNANKGPGSDERYGNMSKIPWYRLRCDDDVLLTAAAMIAELFRVDEKGFSKQRKVENKIIITCRYISVLIAAILKSKGIPCRCRSGFAPYIMQDSSADHWINQYWDYNKDKWLTIDCDAYFIKSPVDFTDIKNNEFDWGARVWLDIRNNNQVHAPEYYSYAGGLTGLQAAIRAVFYDFHCLMNNELSYLFLPAYINNKFDLLSEDDFSEIDELASLMLEPDVNHEALCSIWNTNKKFRILNAPLIGDSDHVNE